MEVNTAARLAIKAQLLSGKKIKVLVSGTSMRPLLRPDENVLVEKMRRVYAGDIVVFEHNQQLLVHRVMKVTRDKIITKGDNAYSTEEIHPDKIYGTALILIKPDNEIDLRSSLWIHKIIALLSFSFNKYWIRKNKNNNVGKNWRKKLLFKMDKKLVNIK